MLFNSYIFIFVLLPVSLVLYFGFNRLKLYSAAKISLIICSLVFYAYFNWSYALIIVSSVVINFILNSVMFLNIGKRLRKTILIIGIVGNIGLLVYFKYLDFFLENLNVIFKADFVMRNIVLPLGISFFTFQQLSYIIDSYRREVPKYNFLDYALFVSFYPQLVAGPIVLHSEIVPQFADLQKKRINTENFSKGIMAFSFGLAKKVLIADKLGVLVNYGYESVDSLGSFMAIVTVLGYTLQIYFDFSGYCDMATGIGKMFNIDIPMNFNSPYKAITVVDFWKRWHITLTRFFTYYVYYPLGGNRKGRFRTYLNIMIVFFLSGLWHGAGYTFIIWGLIHGVANVFTRIFDKTIKKVPKFINWLFCFIFINASWVVFRAESLETAGTLYRKIFAGGGTDILPSVSKALEKNILSNLLLNLGISNNYFVYILILLAAALFLAVFCKNTNERIKDFKFSAKNMLVTAVLLSVSILQLTGVSTFLYFNF